MITKILNHLDDIVKIIEALFYVSMGTVAVLTFLSARKTILQPMKTEVFKNQVEVFTSIMKLFNGKTESEIRHAFDFDEMLRANIFKLLDDYLETFYNVTFDYNERPYNKKACPCSILTSEFAERYLVAPDLSSENESVEKDPPSMSKMEVWNNYIYGEICQTVSNTKMLAQIDEIMKSPFLTSESIRLLSEIKKIVLDNILTIGTVLTDVARELPTKCPNINDLKKRDTMVSIANEYNKKFICIEPYCDKLTKYLRSYFKVESIMT